MKRGANKQAAPVAMRSNAIAFALLRRIGDSDGAFEVEVLSVIFADSMGVKCENMPHRLYMAFCRSV